MPLTIDRTPKVAANLVCMGLLLFFLGLLLGFALIAMAGGKGMLSAHQAALASGAFLMALGQVWETYLRSARSWLAACLWVPPICGSARRTWRSCLIKGPPPAARLGEDAPPDHVRPQSVGLHPAARRGRREPYRKA